MIMVVRSLCLLVLLTLGATGCTAFRPPEYDLPDSDTIPVGQSYTVGQNENIYAIAQKNGVKMRDIIAINHLNPPFALKAGETITLPASSSSASTYTTTSPRRKKSSPFSSDRDVETRSPRTMVTSAAVTAVESEPLPPITTAAPKKAQDPALSSSPQPQTKWTSTPQPAPSSSQVSPAMPLPAPLPAPVTPAASPAEKAPVETASPPPPVTETPAPSAPPEPATKTELSFGWPVKGTVISAFGPKGKGLDNDGINIAAPKSSPVKAAEAGIVVYAGNEMKGFGNLVLIRHQDKWVTAYAHLERLVVAKDTIVAKGDMIGTVGTSGGVSSPQLHFETRLDGKPVDPELMIK